MRNPATQNLSALASCAVHRLIPMVHVGDVERSLAFYALLGLAREDSLKDERGRTCWGSAASADRSGVAGKAEVMFAQADPDPVPEQQAILLYLYSPDVVTLRSHLLTSGLHDGGRYTGCVGPNNGRSVVFAVARPDYMQTGELRVADPDGYCLLIGQLK